MRLTTRGLATVAAGFAFTAACSSPDYIGPNPPRATQVDPDQQFNQLMRRPDLGEVVGRYEEMRGKIKERLQGDLALPEWLDRSDGVNAGCANEFPEVHSHDAGRKSLNHFSVPQAIPADQWPQAKAALAEIGAEYGFTKPGLNASKMLRGMRLVTVGWA